MAIELWLNFKDENGETKRVLVEGETFVIGRTPDNDLQLPLGNLSRKHAEIKRFADVFVISDCGSSNGSTLNDEKLEDPVALKNGDKLNLGNAVEIEIEFVSDKPQAGGADGKGGGSPASDDDDEDEDIPEVSGASSSAKGASASASSDNSGISFGFLLLAPILGVLILLVVGGIILLAGGKKEPDVVQNNYNYNPDNEDEDPDPPGNQKGKTPEKTETPTPGPTSSPGTGGNSTPPPASPEPTVETTQTPKLSGDAEKIDTASASFLRRIAQNDPKAFLTEKQISILNAKINQFKGSSVLAENIKNAKKNASQIETMARSKNLKPQFLANAALTKLGNQKGDVLATAQGMLDVLDNLSIVLGNELAYDNLLVIAAFDQGEAGKNLVMRDEVAKATKNFSNVSSRTIRTIWFLKDNKIISDSQFEFALRFLAIGTITQNPKDFNVQSEALIF